jgi:predicted lipoprotein
MSVRLSKLLIVAIASVLAMPTIAASVDAVPDRKTHAAMVTDVLDRFVVPRVGAFASETQKLAGALDAVCKERTDTARATAAAQFAATVRAWGGLDFIRYGPVAREHRLERVFFWPDPRGTAARQLNTLIAARKPELLQPGALARQSVAVQGLTALEVLLFDDKHPLGAEADEAATYRCALAAAVAANLHGVADEIRAGWEGPDGFRMKMLTPGSDNALYKDASETVREVVKAMAMGLELSRDRFIVPELTAVTATPARRVRLAFEGANLTGAYLEASIAALKDLFDIIGLAAYVPADKPWMRDFLPQAWKSLQADVGTLDTLRQKERGSETHLHALRKMKFDLSGIRQIIFKELAPNADISMGLNELDGD